MNLCTVSCLNCLLTSETKIFQGPHNSKGDLVWDEEDIGHSDGGFIRMLDSGTELVHDVPDWDQLRYSAHVRGCVSTCVCICNSTEL